jgi:phosphoribosylaminoimidazole-succinocarboxamide synthase
MLDKPEIAGWEHIRSGKVRELYKDKSGDLLIVATDRISAFDYVLPTSIPDKGKLLTQLSLFWFEFLSDLVPNHIKSLDVPSEVKDRAVIAIPLTMFPIECVVRGYLTGSGWAEYRNDKSVCGNLLPDGLLDGSQLPTSIFTPATKAEIGDHDENISFMRSVEIVGSETAAELRSLSIAIYEKAKSYAKSRGILLADTKFEFGTDIKGEIRVGDEVLTPDSSRFWNLSTWNPGGAQASFDKQYVRDWLVNSGWDRKSPPPELPDDVVEKTQAKYIEAYELITGRKFR